VASTTKGHPQKTASSPEFFLILDLKMVICGAFLVQFFAVHLKLSGGQYIDTLAQVYFYWGAIAPLAPPGSTPLSRGMHSTACSLASVEFNLVSNMMIHSAELVGQLLLRLHFS